MNPITDIQADAILLQGYPGGICCPEQNWDDNLPVIVVLASCHGRTLLDYFSMCQEFRRRYNIIRLETGPIRMFENRGEEVIKRPAMLKIWQAADILVTNNMGPRHGTFSLERVLPLCRKDVRLITWTAPNFSAFWPVTINYCGAIAALDAFDKGKSPDQVCQDFEQAQFDPLFTLRWRIEMGRLQDRDGTHDIGLSAFVQRNHRTHKLFMGASHPSFTTMAWLGSGIISKLGHPCDTEEQVLQYDFRIGTLAAEPETGYEFKHYGFQYPMRFTGEMGGHIRYISLIREAYEFWKGGGYCTIPLD